MHGRGDEQLVEADTGGAQAEAKMVQPLLLPLFLRIIYSILCNYMKWINDINDIGHSNNINDINLNHTVFHQLCLLRTVCVHVSQTLSLSLSREL